VTLIHFVPLKSPCTMPIMDSLRDWPSRLQLLPNRSFEHPAESRKKVGPIQKLCTCGKQPL